MQYAKPVTLNVEECDRLSFLPYLFGLDFLYAEASVYALAKKMMPEYEGGFWHFIRLPDGGGYMMPDGDRFHLVNGENWFDCVFRSIRSRIGIEVRSAIRIHSINRELNFFYRFLTRFFAAFHYRGIFPQ
ncbi:antirestriction protein [Salmonella enterica]|nr:antirestriction protein [Salmonella enterica]